MPTSDDFPHETTGDPWSSESQFESYRLLGCCLSDQLYTPDLDHWERQPDWPGELEDLVGGAIADQRTRTPGA